MMPHGYDGSLVFREVLFLLKNSLLSLGHDCVIKPNSLAKDRTNIIVGYHLMKFGDFLKDYRYIPYQLEQLDSGNPWYTDNVRKILEHAYDVWDFSDINIAFLKELGIDAKYLPPGYHDSLEIIEHAEKRDIDVLFYGSINQRRKELLEKLSSRCSVKVLQGVFGEERDELIGRSRIVLNMHYYPTRILESVRISFLLNNRCFIITEDSDDMPYKSVDLVAARYRKLIDTCISYIRQPDEMERIRTENYEQFKRKYHMEDLLLNIISE
jgi:hypothetical protein